MDSADEDLERVSDVKDSDDENINMEKSSENAESAVADQEKSINDEDDDEASDVEDTGVKGGKQQKLLFAWLLKMMLHCASYMILSFKAALEDVQFGRM